MNLRLIDLKFNASGAIQGTLFRSLQTWGGARRTSLPQAGFCQPFRLKTHCTRLQHRELAHVLCVKRRPSRTSLNAVSIPRRSFQAADRWWSVRNGSSISTPISSIPNRPYEISSVAGIVDQPKSLTSASGKVKQ